MVNKGQGIADLLLHSGNTILDLLLDGRIEFPVKKAVDASVGIGDGGAGVGLSVCPLEILVGVA